ncbi:tRNA-dihydrouridine(20a/20b) synthase [NAD(P)+]-like isoform X3 [Excalfactoria chinensis]|uniref:tRNA-dihydrouridine(20a/20b) synthase [NAD(P)+]-like isoform X3 n=1 Tax=Excalfactoria chinensis TaxID=46218 RepID=UPI003B3B96D6
MGAGLRDYQDEYRLAGSFLRGAHRGTTSAPCPGRVTQLRPGPHPAGSPPRPAARSTASAPAGRAAGTMTVQWTAVAAFLYGEVGVLLVLCLPFISPLRWQKIFMIPLWSKMAVFWNKMFLTIIVLLIILFLDAVREVRKYSAIQVNEKVANVNANAIDHIQMKLFRSQRNLYISGFSLFLWLVLRRTVTLLTQLAKGMASHAALETQVNDATEAAKKYMAENERLQEALNEKGSGENKEAVETTNGKLRKEIGQLKAELQKTSNALHKANNEVAAVKKQSEGLRREYDNLMKEYERLQNASSKVEDRKDL